MPMLEFRSKPNDNPEKKEREEEEKTEEGVVKEQWSSIPREEAAALGFTLIETEDFVLEPVRSESEAVGPLTLLPL